MENRSRIYQMIKSDMISKIQDMNKIVLSTDIDEQSLTDRALNDKMQKIKEKLNKRRVTILESVEKVPLLSKSSIQRANKFIDVDKDEEFRSFNIFIPKINLAQTNAERTTFSLLKPNYEERIRESSTNIKSLDNEIKNSEIRHKKLNKLNNFKQNFSFFDSKFYEYLYQDTSDKSKGLKRKNTKVYKAFKKLLDDNSNQNFNVSQNSVILNHYDKLLKLEQSYKLSELDEMRVREDDLIYDTKEGEDRIKKYADSKRHNKQALYYNQAHKNNLDNKSYENNSNFKSWFLEEVSILKPEKFSKQTTIEKRESTSINNKPPQEGNKYIKSDISFGIHFQTIIDKAIRLTNNYHPRILQIDGPSAKWYRYKENQTSNIKKGSFDLRDIQIDKPPKQTDSKKEEFSVKFKIKNKLNVEEDKEIKFKSEFFKTLSDKTIRDILEQIKRYYLLINNMLKLHRVDYQKLRFISDPKITQLNIFREESNPETIKNIIENLDWHIKLKRVHLRGIDNTCILKFFSVLNSSNEILIESLTIESTKNSHVIEFDTQANIQLMNLMNTFFSRKCCARLTEFHLVDVKIKEIKPILDILRCKFTFLKKNGKISQSNEDDYNNNINMPISNNMKLPFTKLSFKKSYDNSNSYINICLYELFAFFRDMMTEFECKFENVFESLDISGAECYNIDGLRQIINNFKIVRDLHLSATKLVTTNKCNTVNKEKYIVHNNQQGKLIKTVSINNFLINNVELLKSLNYKDTYDNNDGYSYKKDFNLLSKAYQTSNYPIIYMNIEPILSNLYVLDTPISPEAFTELLYLYKRMKFMKTIHISETLHIVPNGDYIKLNNAICEVKKEDDFYCENFFEIDYTYNENVK